MNNPDLIFSFLSYIRAERGSGENTLASYANAVRHFAAWLERPLGDAERTDIQKYVCDLLNQGINGRTAGHRLAALRHFYRFLIDEEELQTDPTRNLPL